MVLIGYERTVRSVSVCPHLPQYLADACGFHLEENEGLPALVHDRVIARRFRPSALTEVQTQLFNASLFNGEFWSEIQNGQTSKEFVQESWFIFVLGLKKSAFFRALEIHIEKHQGIEI